MKKLTLFFVFCTFISFLVAQKLDEPIVNNIQANALKGTKINVTWQLPQTPNEEIKTLYLYRNTKPITSYTQILSLNPLAILEGLTTSYIDSVKDYNTYYYAIITFTSKPYELILPSVNATVKGAQLIVPEPKIETLQNKEEDKLYNQGTMRETPLPYIDFLEEPSSNTTISDSVVQKTSSFSAPNIKKNTTLLPYFFEEDLISPDGGEEYILFEILKNTFVQQEYKEAKRQLNLLVQRNISLNVLNRSYFYLGECEYFLGNYDSAVKYFVQVSQYFPLQTKKWINETLAKIELEK